MKRSIRTRLLLGTSAAMLLMYGFSCVVLYIAIERSLLNEIDASLMAQARVLARMVELGPYGIRLEGGPHETEPVPDGGGYLIRDVDGRIVGGKGPSALLKMWASQSLPPSSRTMAGYSRCSHVSGFRWCQLNILPRVELDEQEDEPGNNVEGDDPVSTVGETRPVLGLLVYRATRELNVKLMKLLWLLTGIFGLTIIVSLVVLGTVVRRGLQPLAALASRIQRIGMDDLDQRIDLAANPPEVQPVVDHINGMLSRLEESFKWERAFTANVAHELRTPLAGLSTALQVCHSHRRTPEEYERVIARCLSTTRQMCVMVENLLTLARVDSHELSTDPVDVDLEPLVRNLWREFAARAFERGLRIKWAFPRSLGLRTDVDALTIVLRNLLDNAVTYANAHGEVVIGGKCTEQVAMLCISNSGSRIAAKDSRQVFNRLWRGDPARDVTGQHCGLGLALCLQIMQLSGGSIGIETELGGWFTVRLGWTTGADA